MALADHVLGEGSIVLAPWYPGWGMGSVCPGKYPLDSLVRCVLEQIVGSQQAPSPANNTAESQELIVGPVVRIHWEVPGWGSRGCTGEMSILFKVLGGGVYPEDPQGSLGVSHFHLGKEQAKLPYLCSRDCSHPGASEA